MASVTQTIPAFTQGVSQQSEVEMAPGFLKEIQNGVPDMTFGLQKRPGFKYLFTVPNASADELKDGYWFTIIRDPLIPYLGVIIPATLNEDGTVNTYGNIRIWNSGTTDECTINFIQHSDGSDAREYLSSANRDSYKTLTIEKSNLLLNREKVVTESSTNTPTATVIQVSTYADLPTENIDGAVVYQIINSQDTAKDDYYVQYINGAWQEVAKPNIPDGFNNWTAPHVLRQIDDDTFQFSEGLYTDRLVGDEITNPHPTFVNQPIQDCFSYFNRIGFLSNSNVILSETLKPDYISSAPQPVSFYSRSAQVQIASDPVDLNAVSVRAVTLTSVLPAPQGLILFSNNEQFILYADQGVLTPQTAIIKSIGNYELDSVVPPVELGEEFYYINKTARFTRTMRMITRGMENDPIVDEASQLTSEYVPSSVNKLVANPQNKLLILSDSAQPYIWFFKTFIAGGQRAMNAWFKWKVPGNVLLTAFSIDNIFTILGTDDDKIIVCRASLNKTPDSDLLVNVPNPNDVLFRPLIGIGPYLDAWTSDYESTTYDAVNDRTIITPNADYPVINDPQYKPLLILSESQQLRTKELYSNTGKFSPTAGMIFDLTVEADGTFTTPGNVTADANYYVIGYRFEMLYDLPTTYFRIESGADNTASLIISRYKFSYQDSGAVTFQVNDPDDISEFEDIVAVTNTEYYYANALPIFRQVLFTVPIYRRNEYFRFRIYSNSPFPATLNKMSWEGQYAPRFYQRG
jgi:hypothetical protein